MQVKLDIVRQVLDSNIRSIAEKNDVSEEEIQSMIDASEEEIKTDLSEIKRLGYDVYYLSTTNFP